jgi:hypothetical protein
MVGMVEVGKDVRRRKSVKLRVRCCERSAREIQMRKSV